MKLYIKQKVLSINERFTIKDAKGNDIYTIKGSLVKIPKQFKIYDIRGKQVATIHRKLFKIMGQYTIKTEFETITLRRKVTLFRQKFDLDGINWQLSGDFFNHNYRVERGNRIIMRLAKKWISWGDTYELDILSDEDALLALCIAVCIDYEIEKSEEKKRNSSNS